MHLLDLGYHDHAIGVILNIESARPVELQNGGNVAAYRGIFPGIDYRVVHTNTGVRQEFVRSPDRKRELPVPSAYGMSQAELAIRIQVSGDREWSDLLPFQNERGYLDFNERDGLLLVAESSGASKASEVLLETALSVKPDKAFDNALRFDLEASGVPKNATILSASILGGGMNQEVKEQAERWLTEPESNRGLAEFQKPQGSAAQPAQMVVEWVDNTSMVYYLKDHLGSVRATVDDIGQVVAYDDYGPWGLTLEGRSMAAQANLVNKFTGKERDTDFGLGWDYFGARFYDAEVGRWMSPDPLAKKHPDFSAYNYVLNNPQRFIDPDGKQVDVVTGAGRALGLLGRVAPIAPIGIGGIIDASPLDIIEITVEDIPDINVLQERTQQTQAPKKTDPRTAEQDKVRFKQRKDPKLTNAKGDKNRPPDITPPKEPQKVPWWVPLLRLLGQADDATPSDNTNNEQQKNQQQEESSQQAQDDDRQN